MSEELLIRIENLEKRIIDVEMYVKKNRNAKGVNEMDRQFQKLADYILSSPYKDRLGEEDSEGACEFAIRLLKEYEEKEGDIHFHLMNIFSFLTAQQNPIILSSRHDAAIVCDLISEYVKQYNLPTSRYDELLNKMKRFEYVLPNNTGDQSDSNFEKEEGSQITPPITPDAHKTAESGNRSEEETKRHIIFMADFVCFAAAFCERFRHVYPLPHEKIIPIISELKEQFKMQETELKLLDYLLDEDIILGQGYYVPDENFYKVLKIKEIYNK